MDPGWCGALLLGGRARGLKGGRLESAQCWTLIFLGVLLPPTLVGRATKPFVSSLGAFWPGMQALAGAVAGVNGVGRQEGETGGKGRCGEGCEQCGQREGGKAGGLV